MLTDIRPQAQNRRSCPHCTQILFTSTRRTLEKEIKFLTAISAVALLLTLFDIAYAPINRLRIVCDTLVFPHLMVGLVRAILKRHQQGAAWWKNFVGSTETFTEERERMQTIAVALFCLVVGAWLVFQASMLEKRMPDYFLWHVVSSPLKRFGLCQHPMQALSGRSWRRREVTAGLPRVEEARGACNRTRALTL